MPAGDFDQNPTAGAPPILARRWNIAFLLSLGVLINYFDRVNLSVSHDSLLATFKISDFTFGLLAGAYNWTYALAQLPCGYLLDRFGVRRVGCVSTFLWSIASFAAAATPGISGFFAARFLLGIGEAPTFPGNAKAIGYWFPTRSAAFPPASSTRRRSLARRSAFPSSACCCSASDGASASLPPASSACSLCIVLARLS